MKHRLRWSGSRRRSGAGSGVGRSPVAPGVLLGVALLFCGAWAQAGELYVIAAGDTVIVGREIEYYDLDTGVLGLTWAGKFRWNSYSESHYQGGREIQDVSTLTGRKFVLEIDGEVLGEGRITSLLSSALHPGLTLWDSLVPPDDRSIRFQFATYGRELDITDPRESESFLGYFRSHGKLRGQGAEE